MRVLKISRMTSSRTTTRTGWSHQTEGLTDMSHLTNEGTDVARLAKVAQDVARLNYEDTDVAHLANKVTGVAHLIHISTDDAHLVIAKAGMTNVDTIARPRTTATAVTGNDVSDMRSAGREGMCPLTLVGHHHLPDITRDTLIQCRPPVPDLGPEIGIHTDARTVVSRAGPINIHHTIKNNTFLFITVLVLTPSLMMINTIVIGTASMETLE